MVPPSTFKPFAKLIEKTVARDTSVANSVDKIDPFFNPDLFQSHNTISEDETVQVRQRKTNATHEPAIITSAPDPGRITCPEVPSRGKVIRNKDGKRIDSHVKVPEDLLKNIKWRRPKLCNNYHLRGTCDYGTSCGYQHGWLTDLEKTVLREIAKEQPCRYGIGCADADCYAGHRCLMKHKSTEACRFPRGMHFKVCSFRTCSLCIRYLSVKD